MPKAYTEAEYLEACDTHQGFCTECQELTRDMCEPDAENYPCPECDGETVWGMENALLVGHITIR